MAWFHYHLAIINGTSVCPSQGMKMKRTLIKTAVVAACIAGVATSTYAFDLFGVFKSDKSIDDMIEFVPADTAIFFGGVSNKDTVSSTDVMFGSLDYSSVSSGLDELSSMFPDSAGAQFVTWIIDDYYATLPNGGEAVYEHYGLDVQGASVFYMDGLYPVARFGLEDETAFLSLLQQGATETGLELGTMIVDGNSLITIDLVDEDDVKIQLGFLVNDKVLTISAISNKDNAVAQTQRFALTAPAEPLDAKLWKEDGKTYGFSQDFRGFFSLLNTVESFLNKDSKAYQQVSAFAGDEISNNFSELQTQCKTDVLNIVAGVPRLVAGMTDYSVSDNSMTAALTYALEIKNEGILGDLTKLRGFNPSYITNNDELALGLSFGVSTDELPAVISSLWTQFVTAKFECEPLLEAQAEAASFNPSVLGMFSGMAQGLSGVSAGVFDIVADEASPLGSSVDGIVTVTTENPEVLAALISNYLPMAQGIQIPTDGTAVNMAESGMPLDLYVAIKGKHLVAYSGDKATAVAESLAGESTEANGLSSYSLDYAKIAGLVLNSITPLHELTDSYDCTEMYTAAITFQGIPAHITGGQDLTANGLETKVSMSIDNLQDMMKIYGADIAGNYDLAFLDYDCSWVAIGTETLNADGTGFYAEQDETGICNVFKSSYTWDNHLGAMVQSDSENQYRGSCEEEWVDDEPYDFSCQVLAQNDTGFYCLESSEGENTLHRYTKK